MALLQDTIQILDQSSGAPIKFIGDDKQYIRVTAQWSAANANNIITMSHATVETIA